MTFTPTRTSNARSGRRNTGAVMRAFLAGGGWRNLSTVGALLRSCRRGNLSGGISAASVSETVSTLGPRSARTPGHCVHPPRARERFSLSVHGSEISRGALVQCHLLYPPSERVGRGSGRGGLRETSFIQRKTLPARSSRPSQREGGENGCKSSRTRRPVIGKPVRGACERNELRGDGLRAFGRCSRERSRGAAAPAKRHMFEGASDGRAATEDCNV